MSRANPSGVKLTEADASIIKGMLHRGDRQHDIAAYFGVNGGRIAEVSSGDRYPTAKRAKKSQLPPQGPYVYRDSQDQVEKLTVKLLSVQRQLNELSASIGNIIKEATE